MKKQVLWSVMVAGVVTACSKGQPPEATAPAQAPAASPPAAESPPSPPPVKPVSATEKLPSSTEPIPEPEKPLVDVFSWRARSPDLKVVLEQTSNDGGKHCHVRCTKGPQQLWEQDGCLAKLSDLRFVSNDCERLVVLHQLPRPENRWQKVELAHVYQRGKLDYVVQAGGLFKTERQFRWGGNQPIWLRGALDEPGPPPRYSADGSKVEFVTYDGTAHDIPLVRNR